MLPFQYSIYIFGLAPKGKRQLSFVCCKRKMEMSNFLCFLQTENGKQKFVFLGRRTNTNINRRLLFQRTYPSVVKNRGNY
jgi:hypothetical protein